jgi:hypothetical protein
MIDLTRLFDSYNRQARVYPALITLFPPLLTVLAWYPGMLTSNAAAALLTLATSCGLIYALASFARSRGKAVEQSLLLQWGGWPTTLWLRYSDTNLPAQTKQRYHAALTRLVPQLVLPSSAEERANPDLADDAYRSAVEWLKEQCRGKNFPLVEKENAEYGFRRNLLGLKQCALTMALGAFVVSTLGLLHLVVAAQVGSSTDQFLLLCGTAGIDLLAIGFWAFVISERWVRQAADQYARPLLANCDSL